VSRAQNIARFPSYEEVESHIASDQGGVGWVQKELRNSALPDKRLDKRMKLTAEAFARSPVSAIPEACRNWGQTKGAYRLFANKRVEPAAILAPHIGETVERMKKHDIVLAVQDTVFISYSHPKTTGIGPIGKSDSEKGRGLVMHHTLTFSTSGLPLGVLTQKIWARDEVPEETKAEKSKRVQSTPIEEKESWKWLEAAQQTAERAPKGTKVVTVCDRESDLYEFIADQKERDGSFVIRARHDRKLVPEDSEGFASIMEAISQAPSRGTTTVEIRGNGSRISRVATVEIRFVEVTIKPPNKIGGAKASAIIEPIAVRVVSATEVDPPAGQKSISWVLLTSEPVRTFGDAAEKVDWYRLRWGIEVYHKVMKSGCKVEECRLEKGERLARFIALTSIIAFRLMHMTYVARVAPDSPCTEILSSDEIEALSVRSQSLEKAKGKVLTTREAVREIAKLGGFLARKSDGEPGIITLNRGLQRLNEDVAMLRAFKARSGSE
jgi:hypothetical protein